MENTEVQNNRCGVYVCLSLTHMCIHFKYIIGAAFKNLEIWRRDPYQLSPMHGMGIDTGDSHISKGAWTNPRTKTGFTRRTVML